MRSRVDLVGRLLPSDSVQIAEVDALLKEPITSLWGLSKISRRLCAYCCAPNTSLAPVYDRITFFGSSALSPERGDGGQKCSSKTECL